MKVSHAKLEKAKWVNIDINIGRKQKLQRALIVASFFSKINLKLLDCTKKRPFRRWFLGNFLTFSEQLSCLIHVKFWYTLRSEC